jgi:dipeptidyl aminopeptidase/acylaminoacyl peptidase
MSIRSVLHRLSVVVLPSAGAAAALCLSAGAARAQVAEQSYRQPSQVLVDIADAPPTPGVSVGPGAEWLLLQQGPSLPAIRELAEPELRIAGMRISPQTNGPSRARHALSLTFVKMADLSQVPVTGLPAGARIGAARWSPDGQWISFTNTTDDGIELWVARVGEGAAKRLVEAKLNLTMLRGPIWLPDSRTIVAPLVPDGRGATPAESKVPTGPVIQENIGKTAPAPTYQDLLKTPYDADLFEYYASAQLVTVTVDGAIAKIGAPGIIGDVSPSPNGAFLLVETVHRPFSYLVPAGRFPTRIEVVDLQGNPVHLVADLPLQEEVPRGRGSVPTGPRSVSWRSDAPATIAWVEALDGGDGNKDATERDRVFVLAAPFDGAPQALATLGYRYGGIRWGNDDVALVTESWWRTRQSRQWIVRPSRPGTEPELLWEGSYEDRYNDPGSPMMKDNAAGMSVLFTADNGRTLFLRGQGASPEGDRPFVDKLDLRSKKTERIFRSEAPVYEIPVEILDDRGQLLLTSRESQEDPPNYFVRDLRRNTERQITSFPNPTPQLAGMQKEMIQYERADGVALSGTLFLPAGYDPQRDGPLPLFVWAYPREFVDAAAAAQVIGSPYQFTRLGGWSTPIWVARGYAVLDGATMPIVGKDGAEPNDTYVEQLVASAEAAVDEMVRRGVAERGRIGVGGHSYGAFMTANLLTHSDAFAAGIARSGAYNRTLTPFGFQNEERTYWEAPDVYFRMSPFMNVDKINEPILLIHGEADNNSGTFPIQSERYYAALKGLGKTARFVVLPYESHGYSARESILHMLWEMESWLDSYVKKGTPKQ